jgi:hypothetical protein
MKEQRFAGGTTQRHSAAPRPRAQSAALAPPAYGIDFLDGRLAPGREPATRLSGGVLQLLSDKDFVAFRAAAKAMLDKDASLTKPERDELLIKAIKLAKEKDAKEAMEKFEARVKALKDAKSKAQENKQESKDGNENKGETSTVATHRDGRVATALLKTNYYYFTWFDKEGGDPIVAGEMGDPKSGLIGEFESWPEKKGMGTFMLHYAARRMGTGNKVYAGPSVPNAKGFWVDKMGFKVIGRDQKPVEANEVDKILLAGDAHHMEEDADDILDKTRDAVAEWTWK